MRHFFVVSAIILLAFADVAEAQVGTNETLLNPNLASEEDLLAAPGLSEQLVEAIIRGRPFRGISPLHDLLSATLGEAQLEELYRHLWLPLNLNTASRETILLIPGIGNRMAHEFEEYRAYVNIAQFRREMGKYVDDDEVARMEQYVFVPMDLNTATEEDFHTIPGMGNRMVHEFMEYRPYARIEVFRREIGKYVDDDEVARLERYVEVR